MIAAGGYDGTAAQAITEQYNGSSWSSVEDMPAAAAGVGAFGVQTAGIWVVGQISPGPYPNATLSYDGTGIYIGKDGSYYKMSLKSASGDSLTWDGNGTLTITGNITADSGNIGGFTIDGHSLTTSGVEINDSTQTLFINTSNFDVSHAGNVTASNVDLSGKITATSGEIGGWDVQSGYIQKDGTRLNAGSQNGYLGIGTDEPRHPFHVVGSSAAFTADDYSEAGVFIEPYSTVSAGGSAVVVSLDSYTALTA